MTYTSLYRLFLPNSAIAVEARAVAKFNQAKATEKDAAFVSLMDLLASSCSFHKVGDTTWVSCSGLVELEVDADGYRSLTISGALPFSEYRVHPKQVHQHIDRLLACLPGLTKETI